MKLFVDDERFPLTDDWVVVRNATDAKMALLAADALKKQIEVLTLDHDLGEPKDTNNGYAVASFLEAEVLTKGMLPPRVLQVHSGNVDGAFRIIQAFMSVARFCERNGMEIPDIFKLQPLDVCKPQ